MSEPGLIELKLADGTSVFVESTGDRAAGSGPQRVSRGPSGAEEAETRFEDAVARIRPAAQALLDSLRGLNTPEQIDLEFGAHRADPATRRPWSASVSSPSSVPPAAASRR